MPSTAQNHVFIWTWQGITNHPPEWKIVGNNLFWNFCQSQLMWIKNSMKNIENFNFISNFMWLITNEFQVWFCHGLNNNKRLLIQIIPRDFLWSWRNLHVFFPKSSLYKSANSKNKKLRNHASFYWVTCLSI